MYAVFKTGGKQYHAVEGKTLDIEKLPYTEGQSLTFSGLCFTTGQEDTISQVQIEAEPLGMVRGPKVIIFKKNRRHNYRRKRGARQDYLQIKVKKISVQGG